MENTPKILMIIDFQNDFIKSEGKLSINDESLIKKAEDFIKRIEKNTFDEIIVTLDTHFQDSYINTGESLDFPPHCIYGTQGWNFVCDMSSLTSLGETKIIHKSTVNIWNEEQKYICLKKDWSQYTVYLFGVVTEVCVKNALDGLLKKGANVVLIKDLIGGLRIGIQDLLKGEEYVKLCKTGQIQVQSVDDIINSWGKNEE